MDSNQMKIDQVTSVINAISKFIEYNEDEKTRLIDEISKKSDKDCIIMLSSIVFDNINDNELIVYFIDLIRNINLDLYKDVESIKKELNSKHSVYNNIEYLCKLFNTNNIDYYLTGFVPCFIKESIEIRDEVQKIDVLINENDLENVKRILEEDGSIFYDYLFISLEEFNKLKNDKSSSMLLAQYPNDFYINFKLFRRNENESISFLDFNHRVENDDVVTDVIVKEYSSESTKLIFDDTRVNYNNTFFRMNSEEYVYDLKSSSNRIEDMQALSKLNNVIDHEKLKEIRRNTPKKSILRDYRICDNKKL